MEATVVQDSVRFWINDTNHKWNVTILYDGVKMCDVSAKYGDGGLYTISLRQTENKTAAALDARTIKYSCYTFVDEDPTDFWKPIWLAVIILIVFIILLMVLMVINKRYPRLKEEFLKKIGKWNPEDEVTSHVSCPQTGAGLIFN